MTKKEKLQLKNEAREWLSKRIKPGDTIYTRYLRPVGVYGDRAYLCLVAVDGEVVNATYYIAKFLEYRFTREGGIVARYKHDVVTYLSQELFGNSQFLILGTL